MSTTPNPLVGQPNLAQQVAAQNPGPEPTAPISMPDAGVPPAVPSQPQAQVKGPSPWQRAVHALLGSQTEFNQTPNGPVPVQVQNKPGQLFRSILAGAILGAGAGTANAEHNAGSGWNAAGAGARAVTQNAQQQQQQAQQQAQQQFENQRQVDQDKQQEIARKAETALHNAQTLRLNHETQGLDFADHVKVADMGKASAADYDNAGVHPVVEGLSEDQMQQYVKDHPDSTTLDWIHTGVKTGTTKDADGNEIPTYQYTLSAYDPKAKVSVSPATYKQWKDNGVFDRFPEYASILTNGKTLTAQQYKHIKADAEGVVADNTAKKKEQNSLLMETAQIEEVKARTKQALASAYNENMSAQEKKDNKDKQKALDTAWDHFDLAGNDPNKAPMTAEDRITIGRNAQPLIQDSLSALKIAMNDPSQQDKVPELMSNYQSLARLAQLGTTGGGGKVAHPEVVTILGGVPGFDPQIAQKIANLTPDEIATQLQSSRLPADVKNKILTSIGKPPVAPPSPAFVPNEAGRAVGNAVPAAISAAQQAAPFIP